MKISELQEMLRAAKQQSGDVDVVLLTDTPDGMFHLEWRPKADVIQVPVSSYSDKEETVFALGWETVLPEDEEKPVKKYRLRSVT